MRIDGKIEKTTGKAILLLPDAPAKGPNWVLVYSATDQHSEATRDYVRTQCRNPKGLDETYRVLHLIREWANLPIA